MKLGIKWLTANEAIESIKGITLGEFMPWMEKIDRYGDLLYQIGYGTKYGKMNPSPRKATDHDLDQVRLFNEEFKGRFTCAENSIQEDPLQLEKEIGRIVAQFANTAKEANALSEAITTLVEKLSPQAFSER